MTSVREELDALKRWRLKPEYRGLKLFEDLARAEFLPEGEQRRINDKRVAAIARFAAEQAPFYRDYFAEQSLRVDAVRGVADLPRLPVLRKETVIRRERELHADHLPANEVANYTAMSSGTTGKRTRVRMTHRANMMFSILNIRLYRWYRMDLSRTLAAILAPRAFADPLDKSPPHGVRKELGEWPLASTFFETGSSVLLCNTYDVEERQAWLEQYRPGCLIADPSVLEEHAFARPDGVLDSLAGVFGISSHMDRFMRRRIERSFGVPVDQNYGANEFGVIAGRCRHGRYHVHTEHCFAEIADADGQPCAPGERGRILLTGFSNMAMPLLRFDIGDLGTVPDGPCPCGRTLPGFVDIEGKFRRWVNVPPGTAAKFLVVTEAFNGLPPALLRDVRGYQLHLNRDNTFVFRVHANSDLPPGMVDAVLRIWDASYPGEAGRLSLARVDGFEKPPNGKVPGFTTDYPDEPFAPKAG